MKDIKLALTVIITLVLVLIGALIYKGRSYKEYTRNYFYMDTYINVKIYERSKSKALKALDEIDNIYKNYHNLTDRYNAYDLGLYNLNHGDNKIDKKVYDIIKYGYEFYEDSKGLFNIAIGNTVDIWKMHKENNTVPSTEELFSKSINIKRIDLSDIKVSNDIVSNIKLDNVTIDLGGLAKGYVTDIVADYLKDNNIPHYIINAGGNVLVGSPLNKEYFKIGLEDPLGEVSVYKVIKAKEMAIVTSGGYNRNYTVDGVSYGHIIDPNTRMPKDNYLSVSVVAKDSKLADLLSTTLYLMNVEDGMELIKKYGADAIWYLKDGTITKSEGFSKYE